MPISDTLQILGLLTLSAFLFYTGASKRTLLYHGRGRRDAPFTRGQQKLVGLLWGSAVLVAALLKILGTLGKISEEVWDRLYTIVFVGSVVLTIIMTLVDPRARATMMASRYGRFAFRLFWFAIVLFSLLVVREIWILLRLLTDRFVL